MHHLFCLGLLRSILKVSTERFTQRIVKTQSELQQLCAQQTILRFLFLYSLFRLSQRGLTPTFKKNFSRMTRFGI